ncbi:Basic helix-loop-helix DNA-binding superfamily protein isoform 1 [Hibiscus syriacus]|uniref:Basic helix-loop-helix DNA-binding superfamily protein isoform 1 n=1 Tax=Hibiscus syriacus TaxID=106335 RepID=A0A6A2Z3V7_HIBSY|nr:Basic helix-loop-helix DNA-binding superfamily protein isoform 1 [Hibiscus syriacus]
MKEKENRTPRKEHPRSSDLVSRRPNDSPAKRIPKKASNARKSLTEAFISPIEDVLLDISEVSIDFSSISAFSDANFNMENAEDPVIPSNPLLSTSLETFMLFEIAPCSKLSTTNKDEQKDFSKTGLAEVGILVNLLKQARLQALNSADMKNKSKKVLDALIEFIIKEFHTLPQERDKLPEVSTNAYS